MQSNTKLADPMDGLSPFVVKLLKVLDSAPTEIIQWSENGEVVMILDVARFASEVMPLYFRSDKMDSFKRQANYYGFSKLAGIPKTKFYFYHDLFKRGKYAQMKHIVRHLSHPGSPAPNLTELNQLRLTIRQLRKSIAHLESAQETHIRLIQRQKTENNILQKQRDAAVEQVESMKRQLSQTTQHSYCTEEDNSPQKHSKRLRNDDDDTEDTQSLCGEEFFPRFDPLVAQDDMPDIDMLFSSDVFTDWYIPNTVDNDK